MIEVRKNHQMFERQAKEERTRLLNELSTMRHRLGEEKGRNESIEKVYYHLLGALQWHVLTCHRRWRPRC